MSDMKSYCAVFPLWSEELQSLPLAQAARMATWRLADDLSVMGLRPRSAARWETRDGAGGSVDLVAAVLVTPWKVLGG
jgi:Ser/Thr protein kinase RdoA (MazF antagonist)